MTTIICPLLQPFPCGEDEVKLCVSATFFPVLLGLLRVSSYLFNSFCLAACGFTFSNNNFFYRKVPPLSSDPFIAIMINDNNNMSSSSAISLWGRRSQTLRFCHFLPCFAWPACFLYLFNSFCFAAFNNFF
jgi:hypothetical protein